MVVQLLQHFTILQSESTDVENQFVTRAFSLTSSYSYSADFLIIVGGGRGARRRGGGGGAGGYLTNYGGSAYTLGTGITYTVTVGNGGAAKATNNMGRGYQGQNSVFSGSNITDITSIGGGGGGGTASYANGGTGGSGGGASASASGGAGTSGQD